MKINIIKNNNLDDNEIVLDIQHSGNYKELKKLVDYINHYELSCNNKVIVMDDNYSLLEVEYADIVMFCSDKKNNYCVVKDKRYRVKGKLYELEKININFIRISKNCIVNINHVKKFDMSETGKIIVIMDNNAEQIVSRRRTSEIMKYLESRRI